MMLAHLGLRFYEMAHIHRAAIYNTKSVSILSIAFLLFAKNCHPPEISSTHRLSV